MHILTNKISQIITQSVQVSPPFFGIESPTENNDPFFTGFVQQRNFLHSPHPVTHNQIKALHRKMEKKFYM